jgi:hypothetical protein
MKTAGAGSGELLNAEMCKKDLKQDGQDKQDVRRIFERHYPAYPDILLISLLCIKNT